MLSLSFESHLRIPAEEFLKTLTMAGVNAELAPLARMTVPESFSALNILDWPERQTLFQSWILLFGLLPIDRHTFFFESIDSGHGFSERSKSWVNQYWCHERKVISAKSGCKLEDTVSFKSRVPLIDMMLMPSYQLIFWLRHKNLRRRYGGSAS